MSEKASLLGRVLLIAVDGALRPSRVVGVSGNKLEHENLEGVTGHMALKRALWVSQQRCDSASALAEYWEHVSAAAATLDLAALWNATTHADKSGPEEPAAILERAERPAGPREEDALVCAVFADRLHFRFRAGKISTNSPKALREAIVAQEARQQAARHRTIAQRLLMERRQGRAGEPANSDEAEALEHHIRALEDLAVNAKAAEHYRVSLGLMRDLDVDLTVPVVSAARLLAELGIWTRHENVALRRSGLAEGHSSDLLAQACELASEPPDLRGRIDYRSLLTIAIDDAHTEEVDDAFAVDGSRIVVFISDAAAWVPLHSDVFADAAERASTMYLPEGRFPMLPPALGQRHASLMEGEERLALAYSFSLDADGKPVDFRVERAWMRVDRRLVYSEVDRVLEGTGTDLDAGIIDLIYTGAQLMDDHAAWRASCGAISFTRDEVNLVANPQTGHVAIHPSDPNGPARQLVAEMMVAVCGGAASFCLRHGIPTVYRSQPPPDDPIERPNQPVSGAWEQWNILRRFKPSKISVKPATHYSLALPVYTQVSSPLRRLQDLIMNHQLAAFVAGQTPPFDDAQLRSHIAQIEVRTGEIRSIESASRRYWALWYLETHPDQTLQGLVVHEAGRRWVIRVPELALVLTMQPRRRLRRSQRVKLQVVEVDARRDRLVLVDV